MSRPTQTSTTSYALTGLLALRSWTAYELAHQMRRALRWAWPRSEANVYSEIKRLVPHGLAASVEEDHGGRRRSRYQITDDGRAALTDWLRTEPAPVQVQFETLLRVFLADLGSRQELENALAATRRQVRQTVEELLPIVEDYAGDEPPFPGRAHLNVLFISFMANFFRLVLQWCDEAEAEIATWPATADVGLTPGTRRMVEDALAFYRSVVADHGDPPAGRRRQPRSPG
jgi:PadR family transcriptional regulator, regulatory protein AphA